MATIKINFLISHENILKFGLEIITWPQNQKKKLQIILYNNINHCLCSLSSLKSLLHSYSSHFFINPLILARHQKVILDITFSFTPSFTMSGH